MSKCRDRGSGSKIQINNLAELPVDPKLLEMILNGQIQVVYNLNAKAVVQTLPGGEPSTGFISGSEWYLRNPGERGIHNILAVPNQALTEDTSRTIPENRNARIEHVFANIAGVPNAGKASIIMDITRVDGDTQRFLNLSVSTGETIEDVRKDGMMAYYAGISLFSGDRIRIRLLNEGAAAISMAYAVSVIEFDDGHTGTGGTP